MPPKVDGVYVHRGDCECDWCSSSAVLPRYVDLPKPEPLIRSEEEVFDVARQRFDIESKPAGPPPTASRLGLVATWSVDFGYVSLHDPIAGEWHDIPTKDAPAWAKAEAFRRRGLYKSGNWKAYSLTANEMEKLWEAEHLAEEEGIVEEHPLEEGA
jgi:hypothetical protein